MCRLLRKGVMTVLFKQYTLNQQDQPQKMNTKRQPFHFFNKIIINTNKKVLLRECKRHTARHVSNARDAGGGTRSQVWGGYSVPGPGGYLVIGPLGGGTPYLVRGGTWSQVCRGYLVPGLGGYPIPGPKGWGVPHPRSGEYPILGLAGGMGSPPARPGMGYPPCHQT